MVCCLPTSPLARGPFRILALACTGAFLLAGCGQKPSHHEEPPRPVLSEVIRPAPLLDGWSLAGEVRARTEASYAFQTGGRVIERRVDTGDAVTTGQVLARIDPVDLKPLVNARRAEQLAARSELQLARADLERAERMHARNFVSSANVDRARAAVDVAQAKLKAANAQAHQADNAFGYRQLVSKVDGVVTAVQVEAGQVVAAGQPVMRVAAQGDVEVAVAIPEADLARTRSAGTWRVEFPGLPGKHWEAMLRELSPAADPASRTYAARLALQGDTHEVALGMIAVVQAPRTNADVLSVPLSALYSRDAGTQVWVLDRTSSTVRARPVVLGAASGNRVVIRQGLSAGDEVVVAGANLLRNGQKVRLPGERQDKQGTGSAGQDRAEDHERPDGQREDRGA